MQHHVSEEQYPAEERHTEGCAMICASGCDACFIPLRRGLQHDLVHRAEYGE